MWLVNVGSGKPQASIKVEDFVGCGTKENIGGIARVWVVGMGHSRGLRT